MSGEFWVLSYGLPYAYFSVTRGIMLGRHGGKCVFWPVNSEIHKGDICLKT